MVNYWSYRVVYVHMCTLEIIEVNNIRFLQILHFSSLLNFGWKMLQMY